MAGESSIKPLLLRRFPQTSADGLQMARSYAYRGSVIQDLGYYPSGNKFFSNLLHYSRSGDFVEALVHDARDVNELAFAIGALAHYANDKARTEGLERCSGPAGRLGGKPVARIFARSERVIDTCSRM